MRAHERAGSGDRGSDRESAHETERGLELRGERKGVKEGCDDDYNSKRSDIYLLLEQDGSEHVHWHACNTAVNRRVRRELEADFE